MTHKTKRTSVNLKTNLLLIRPQILNCPEFIHWVGANFKRHQNWTFISCIGRNGKLKHCLYLHFLLFTLTCEDSNNPIINNDKNMHLISFNINRIYVKPSLYRFLVWESLITLRSHGSNFHAHTNLNLLSIYTLLVTTTTKLHTISQLNVACTSKVEDFCWKCTKSCRINSVHNIFYRLRRAYLDTMFHFIAHFLAFSNIPVTTDILFSATQNTPNHKLEA